MSIDGLGGTHTHTHTGPALVSSAGKGTRNNEHPLSFGEPGARASSALTSLRGPFVENPFQVVIIQNWFEELKGVA